MVDQEISYCKLCGLDIKKTEYYIVYSKILDDIICSGCCLMAIYYHFNMLPVLTFEKLPENVKKYCIEVHKKELEKEKNIKEVEVSWN